MSRPTGFTTEQVRTIMFRDGHKCAMCGRRAEVANHRANRGAGGFKAANTMANGCALCHQCNGRIESDADYAAEARRRGVKISKHDDPRTVRYLSPLYNVPVYLLDDGGLTFALEPTAVSPGAVPTMTPHT